MNNEFYNTNQEIIAGQDIYMLEDARHEIYDPIEVGDDDGKVWISDKIREIRRQCIPYALTVSDGDKYYHLWVAGQGKPMPDDGGDE